MYYSELFKTLYRDNIRYMVADGLAVVLKGIPRLTMDIDLIVDLEEGNLRAFLNVLQSLGYRPKLPVDPEDFLNFDIRRKWREEKNMLVFNFYHPEKPTEQIDVFTQLPCPFDELYGNRETEHLGEIEIPIISTKDLIEMKRVAGRKQDLSDIELLEKLNEEK